MTVLSNNYFIYSGLFVSGYTLHALNGKIIDFSRETLGCDVDLYKGLPEHEYRQRFIEERLDQTPPGASRSAFLKTVILSELVRHVSYAVAEEILLRTLLQKRFLTPLKLSKPTIVVISTLAFSFAHLLNKNQTRAQKKAILIHTSILGLFSAIACEKFSTKASIAIHVGYNLRAWKLTYLDTAPEL